MRVIHLVCWALMALALASAGGPALARRSATPQDTRNDRPQGAWASDTTEARDCSRTRRKFWHPDRGWIVRAVVSCR